MSDTKPAYDPFGGNQAPQSAPVAPISGIDINNRQAGLLKECHDLLSAGKAELSRLQGLLPDVKGHAVVGGSGGAFGHAMSILHAAIRYVEEQIVKLPPAPESPPSADAAPSETPAQAETIETSLQADQIPITPTEAPAPAQGK